MHNETATGMMLPIPIKIRAVIDETKHKALFLVDYDFLARLA